MDTKHTYILTNTFKFFNTLNTCVNTLYEISAELILCMLVFTDTGSESTM